jgi:hypothetical protein
MTAKFLRIARQGENSWKRYLIGVLLPFCLTVIIWIFFFIILGIIYYILGVPLDYTDEEAMNELSYLGTGLMFISLIFGLYLSIKRVHKRNFITLFTSETSVRWQRVIKGFGVYLLLSGISFLVWYLIAPSRFIFSFSASEWLPFAWLALVFCPIAALCIVLFFAYLLQGIGLLIRSPLLLSIVLGFIFIFGSLIYASEPKTLLYWFMEVAARIFFFWVIIKDNGIELIWGLFTAQGMNDLFGLSFDGSEVWNTPTLFRITETDPNFYDLLNMLLIYGLFYYICFVKGKNSSASTPEE